jgi:hypothetical protein
VTGSQKQQVDFFLFYFLSFPPFYEGNHMKTYRRILHDNVKYPSNFSSSVKLFISGLLQKKQTQRLGIVKGGIDRIKVTFFFYVHIICAAQKFLPK